MLNLPSVYDSPEYAGKPSKKYYKQLKKINKYQDKYQNCSLDELKNYARAFDVVYQRTGKLDIEKLYACAREVTYRLLGKFQYDVQILGALAALDRNVIQMSTGSGKTITLILPALAQGLTHKGCHVLTVNDYLSKRDWEEVHPVFDFFGVSSAYTSQDFPIEQKQEAFNKDITYCTNTTLGFSCLNSSLASGIGQDIKIIDRPLHSALIDEVDEILMDDARNPLIIANSKSLADTLTKVVHKGRIFQVQDMVNQLRHLSYLEYDMKDGGKPFIGDATWDEIMSLFNVDRSIFRNPKFIHVVDQAIQAHFHLKRYVDYIVADEPDPDSGSRVILIDKATGRLSHGRTLNEHLHAFVEMKEGVFTGVASESTLQITYQALFNLYTHIAGVTGTVGTSYKEFEEIYQCGIVLVPDKQPSQLEQQTRLYPTYEHLYDALIYETKWLAMAGFPILIGAKSDGDARIISEKLDQNGLVHKTLVSIDTNEEEVIESAGEWGSIVVTTDIMGRGTDIHLRDNTNDKGLVVFQVGARPNSRVERQFAGRAGRQGLPGQYYRLLTLTDWDEMGWLQSDLKYMTQQYREKGSNYHHDLLQNGHLADYEANVRRIDHALNARESAYSQSRVQAYRTSAIVDLAQTAFIAQMDKNRQALKSSIEGYHYPLLEQVAYWSLPEGDRQDKKIKKRLKELEGAPVQYLQNKLYDFTNHIIHQFIPEMRQFGDTAAQTVSLASGIGFTTPPEQHLEELMREFWKNTSDQFILAI